MALDRRTIGLLALFALVLLGALIRAAYMAPPFTVGDVVQIVLLSLLAFSSLAGALWTGRASAAVAVDMERRELADALELTAVMVVDDCGVIRHWSRGCEELYGWSAVHAVGARRVDLLCSRSRQSLKGLWSSLLREGRMTNEMVEYHRDGRQLIVHDNIKLLDRGDGRHEAVIAVTDVTEWRCAQDALRMSEARLATAVSVQGIFIYEIDLPSRRPIWTSPGEMFFGRPLENCAGGRPVDEPGPEHYTHMRKALEAIEASGHDRVHFDFEFDHPRRGKRLAEGWARIIRDLDGRPLRLLGTHLDVTERRARERALRSGEAEREAILATVPDAMFVCNQRGVVRVCSASACRLLGYSEAELVGRRLVDLIEDDRGRSAIRRDLRAALHRGLESEWPLPISLRRADGEILPLSFVIGHTRIDGARLFVVFGRDMRPAIATEERFRRMNNDLSQVSRLGMMGEMAAVLAHELSQPLSAVVNFLGAVDLMLGSTEEPDPDRLRHAVVRASEQASRAGEIIRRLRAFILRGEADMRAELLPALAREAAALALFNSGAFGIRLHYEFEEEDRYVLCDRVQIQQVLVNLIRNAADAMAAKGNGPHDLTIATTLARDDLIEVQVRDSGPGVAPEMLERLFRPFATTKREGLGFGLAISRRIIEAHGGQLSAASVPGGGAVFAFTLQPMAGEGGR